MLAHVGVLSLDELERDVEETGRIAAMSIDSAPGVFALAAAGRRTHVLREDAQTVESVAAVLDKAEVVVFDYASLQPQLITAVGNAQSVFDAAIAARLVAAGTVDSTSRIDLERVANVVSELPQGYPTLHPGPARADDPLGRLVERAEYLVSAAEVLEQKIARLGLGDVWEMERAVTPMLRRMTERGVGVDRVGWAALVAQREREACQFASVVEQTLGIANIDDSEQVRDRLRAHGVETDATNSTSLAPHFGTPGVRELVELRRRKAFLRDLGPKVLDAVEDDGRAHPEWVQLGTTTGRITCRNPALTSTPREQAVRGLFVPAPWHVFVCGDYPQTELRVAAAVVNEQALLQQFRAATTDPHAETAARMLGKRALDVTRGERQAAKALNFGVLYDLQPAGLAEQVQAGLGVPISLDDAAAYIEAFRHTHPALAAYQDAQRASPPSTTRSMGGRLRVHAPSDSIGARLAAPFQATVADIIKYALVLLQDYLDELQAEIVLVVYDEIVLEVPRHNADDARQLLQAIMCAAFDRFCKAVPAGVVAETRSSWAVEQ